MLLRKAVQKKHQELSILSKSGAWQRKTSEAKGEELPKAHQEEGRVVERCKRRPEARTHPRNWLEMFSLAILNI